jgi:hypothetical protein
MHVHIYTTHTCTYYWSRVRTWLHAYYSYYRKSAGWLRYTNVYTHASYLSNWLCMYVYVHMELVIIGRPAPIIIALCVYTHVHASCMRTCIVRCRRNVYSCFHFSTWINNTWTMDYGVRSPYRKYESCHCQQINCACGILVLYTSLYAFTCRCSCMQYIWCSSLRACIMNWFNN